MNHELVELSTGLIFIKISTSNLNVLHALKYYFFSSQSWWVQLLNTELAQKFLILIVDVFAGIGILANISSD